MVGSKKDGVHVIDVNKLVRSMTRKQEPECSRGDIQERKDEFISIPMLKQHYSERDKEAYETTVLSIGPYHHTTKTSLDIEKLKWESFSYILQINPMKKMRDYIVGMEEVEQQIRSCYANPINMSKDNFLRMMLLDGCFILYLLHGLKGVVPTENCTVSNMYEMKSRLEQDTCEFNIHIEDEASQQRVPDDNQHDKTKDTIHYTRQWYSTFFTHDLLLLENQIPFFVVMKIYKLVTEGRNTSTSLPLESIANSMEYLIYSYPKRALKFEAQKKFHHLLHLCHMYFKPGQVIVNTDQDYPKPLPNDEVQHLWNNFSKKIEHSATKVSESSPQLQEPPRWHRASEYHRGGIEFRKREILIEDPHSLLDIGFCDGFLEMPSLTVDTNTNSLFRNMVAFEQSSPQVGNYMTTYVVFLSQFVSEPDDVSLLTKRGIIVHGLNTDAKVSDLFRLLAEGVTFSLNCDHYLKPLCYRMEVYYQIWRSRWNRWLRPITSRSPNRSLESTRESDQFPEKLPAEQYV